METALRCMVFQKQSSWSCQLVCVEYTPNSLSSSSTRLSPVCTAISLHSSLLWTKRSSFYLHFPRCHRTWAQARVNIQRTVEHYTISADRGHTSVPVGGQRVWLLSKDLPLCVESQKLATKFISPFVIQTVISPIMVRLALPRTMSIHTTFHVSRIKPVKESHHAHTSPPSPCLINRGPAFIVCRLIRSRLKTSPKCTLTL